MRPPCSRNGARSEMLPSSTRRVNPGIAWSIKESTCSSDSRKTIACASEAPKQNLQIKMVRALPGGHEFVAYLDAIGELDGNHASSTGRRPPAGIRRNRRACCRSIRSSSAIPGSAGFQNVALVVFVRKHHAGNSIPQGIHHRGATPGIRPTWSKRPLSRSKPGEFPAHSGIRFPQNGCMSCAHLGLCLNNQQLIDANLIRIAGASDLDWLDELMD